MPRRETGRPGSSVRTTFECAPSGTEVIRSLDSPVRHTGVVQWTEGLSRPRTPPRVNRMWEVDRVVTHCTLTDPIP